MRGTNIHTKLDNSGRERHGEKEREMATAWTKISSCSIIVKGQAIVLIVLVEWVGIYIHYDRYLQIKHKLNTLNMIHINYNKASR